MPPSSLRQGQDVVLNSLQQKFNDTSGVNIDDEMANLLTCRIPTLPTRA